MDRRSYHFFPFHEKRILASLGVDLALQALQQMLLIRHFEQRGEMAYLQGKVGGFYHSYIGQEAIQTACIAACGKTHWYTTTYRCHALALLLGASPNALMAELYGRSTGIAKGVGGSMHMYANRLLGGFGIVGGHVPIATGAAFSIKYLKQNGLASFCFLGEGAVAQGAVHESLNLAALWNLPCVYVIENNQWGMGTSVERAICIQPIAENISKAYGVKSYTFDGMDFLNCYAGFREALHECVSASRPILIEAVTQRFRGHSISDPAAYRTKEEFEEVVKQDPILRLKKVLIDEGICTEDEYIKIDREQRDVALAAMQFADESPWPDPIILEEGVFAPGEQG